MSATPRASFVIPARNVAGTLARTLDSLLAQGDHAWEALIVDDGSRSFSFSGGAIAFCGVLVIRDRFAVLRPLF